VAVRSAPVAIQSVAITMRTILPFHYRLRRVERRSLRPSYPDLKGRFAPLPGPGCAVFMRSLGPAAFHFFPRRKACLNLMRCTCLLISNAIYSGVSVGWLGRAQAALPSMRDIGMWIAGRTAKKVLKHLRTSGGETIPRQPRRSPCRSGRVLHVVVVKCRRHVHAAADFRQALSLAFVG
jgi:hypothetical protein